MARLAVYTGNEASNYFQFRDWLGEEADGVLGYTSGGSNNNDWNAPDPGWQINTTEYLGATNRPIYWSIPMAPDTAGVAEYQQIANGQHNAMYRGWAQQMLADRSGDSDNIYVRTTWELGGEWFPWTQPALDNPAVFKAAWQQFAQSFHDVSSRFKMVWDITGDRPLPVDQLYPGDAYVDVISQDIYWSPEYAGNDPDAAFVWNRNREHGLDWMVDFAAQHGKPMALSEWGTPGNRPDLDAARYIENVRNWIETHNVDYATYWNTGAESGYDGRLSDNAPAPAAAALRDLYLDGVPGGGTPPPPPPPGSTTPTAGNDNITGTAGGDTINALAGNDTVNGGDGADTITGGQGYDQVTGGAGADTFVFALGHGGPQPNHDWIMDFQVGTDRLQIPTGATGEISDDPAGDFIHFGTNVADTDWVQLRGVQVATLASLTSPSPPPPPPPPGGGTTPTAGNDTLTGTAGADTINALAGNDTVNALAGNDNVNGGAGNDTLNGGAGDDLLNGGTGTDTAVFAGSVGSYGFALSGTNQVAVSALLGTDGTDTLSGIEQVSFNGAVLTLRVGSNGNNTVNGAAGVADLVLGFNGNDTLNGLSGNDVLVGGAGKDTITGGAGSDTFLFASAATAGNGTNTNTGRDVITDFNRSEGDLIDLSGIDAISGGANNAFVFIGGANFSAAGQLRYFQQGNTTIIEGNVSGTSGAEFQIQLSGIHALVASDFVL